MATTTGPEATHLEDQLAADPYRFDFFRAVRLLEALHRDRPRIGCAPTPAEDFVRFGQASSMSFAPSTLQSFELRTDLPPRLIVHFFGLLGPNGPLPSHITEFAYEREFNAHDPTLIEFLNVFHHRLLALFYRAWAANQKAVDFDRPEESRFARYFGSLFGIGMESLQNRDAVADFAKLFFSGRLAPQCRNSEGLSAILTSYFGLPVRVENFVGRWLDLPADSLCRLGESPASGSLGQTTLVGARMWDCQLKFRLRLGPMCLADLEHLLPEGEAFLRLKTWVMNYVGDEFFWDAQLVLQAAEVPSIQLGQASRLGWTSWLRTGPFTRDADDVILQP